jgi:CO dehydrogenase maturation factor
MKLAVTGKGGVGKTTVCALLARAFADAGRRVIAVDADPNATLASCLGFCDPDAITPLIEMEDLIEERTGVKPGTQGAIFKLNPRVEDIPERFCTTQEGVRLLRMGALKRGGAGCYCPENAFLKSLVSHLFLVEQDVLIMDMEAGVEHFGRGTAQGVDWLLIVVEPSRQSAETAGRIRSLAGDIGLSRLGVIGNKCRGDEERDFIARSVAPLPLLGAIPYDDGLRLAEQEGRPPEASQAAVGEEVKKIAAQLGG